MTTGTPQAQAILVSNSLILIAQNLMNMYDQIGVLATQWNDQSVANTLASLQTVATTTDGSVGTSDPSPVNTHMLNVTVYSSLSRAITPLQITQIKTVLDAVKSYIDGQAQSANPGARAILNVATGG